MRAILTYHSIDRSGSPISVHPAVFEGHVRWLASGAVRALPLEDLMAADDGMDAVALTFDDGFSNFATEAVPRLAAHGIPATVFVVTEHVGRTNEWGGRRDPGVPTLPLLDWTDLGHLARSGIAIGAHTRTHPDLTVLSEAEIEDEITGSAERLRSELGLAAHAFAYPYGRLNAAAVRTAQRFQWACTTEFRVLGGASDPARLPRLDMYYFGGRWPLTAWGTPSFRAYVGVRRMARRSRAWVHGRHGGQALQPAGSWR